MRFQSFVVSLAVSAALAGAIAFGREDGAEAPKRVVLVELYTSQGCDMCPEAEKILGSLGEQNKNIAPVAFHVDYFNEPWQDVFSDPLYSRRQQTYNQLYTGPKNPEYGLYYTPMLMIDGQEPVNGRDPQAAQAAIRRAAAKKPLVDINVVLELKNKGLSGDALIKVASLSGRVPNSDLLLCAVLREDRVVTDILSGENEGKSLVARYPARTTKYDFIELGGDSPVSKRFSFEIDGGWKQKNVRLAVFVQDKRTGAVYQASDYPWKSTSTASDRSKAKAQSKSQRSVALQNRTRQLHAKASLERRDIKPETRSSECFTPTCLLPCDSNAQRWQSRGSTAAPIRLSGPTSISRSRTSPMGPRFLPG